MSWMARLHDTYEAGLCLDIPIDQRPMPINHTAQNAHIRIVLDGAGNFRRAEVLDKTQVILPATEQSAGRTSGEAPHPLADKIQYVAKDYAKHGGRKREYFDGYLRQLKAWTFSEHSHSAIVAVHKYVAKGRVVADLVAHKIMHVGSDNRLLTTWAHAEGDIPALLRVLPKQKGKFEQGSALVCWTVERDGVPTSDTWKDPEVQGSWSKFIEAAESAPEFCFITGKNLPPAVNHPARLRHSGDKAKLVSANDEQGFTFRGRFINAAQTAVVASTVTQKVHSALRWLISRQGYRNGDQVVVAWAVSGSLIPGPLLDSWAMLAQEAPPVPGPQDRQANNNHVDHSRDVGQSFADALRKRIAGYHAKLPVADNVIVMGLDSATPGRMAITYYQEFSPNDFLERVSEWHLDFAWYQRRTLEVSNGDRRRRQTTWMVGAPSPKAIAEAVYGEAISDTLKRSTVERILPCVVQGRPLPRDLVDKAFRRVVNRHAYKSDQQWLWEKDLGIACALFKGFSKRNGVYRREFAMALEEDNRSRDYLFGRLLAIAEKLEEMALFVAGESRPTTAARLMQRFADRPAPTWRNIELALQPYIQRLKVNRSGFLHKHERLLDDVMAKFQPNDFDMNKPLAGEFLLAFHAQRLELNKKSAPDADLLPAEATRG